MDLMRRIQAKEKEGWECVSKVQWDETSNFYVARPKHFVIMEKTYSNTFKANETPREVLLERDVTLLFNENRELKEKNRKLLKLLKTYQEVVEDDL